MKKNLAIIGASYLQMPLIEKAKSMGYTTHVFAWAADDVGEKAADFFYPISIVELDKITEKCKEIGICGICSIASDLAAITVNYVADKLGLVGNPMEATYKSTNKHLMRLAFEQNNDPSPVSFLIKNQSDIPFSKLSFPVVIKPTDRSGSRGICKLESPDGILEAVEQAKRESFEKQALIEEFVGGEEYSVEAISYRGVHTILAMTLKFTTGAPQYIEVGHLEPAPVSKKVFNQAGQIVKHALNSLGIMNGASHSEIKIADDESIKIIEIGGRMGGDCIGSDLVKYSTGIDYVKAVIQIACGDPPDLTPVSTGFSVSSRYIFTEDDLKKMEMIKREEPGRLLKLVYLKKELLNKTTNSSDRAGCYILKEVIE